MPIQRKFACEYGPQLLRKAIQDVKAWVENPRRTGEVIKVGCVTQGTVTSVIHLLD